MTGFGKAVAVIADKKVIVEIKSLNSKQLDLNMRCAQQYRECEMEFRSMILKAVQRGKVDFTLTVETNQATEAPLFNKDVVMAYKKQIDEFMEGVSAPGIFHSDFIQRMDLA